MAGYISVPHSKNVGLTSSVKSAICLPGFEIQF